MADYRNSNIKSRGIRNNNPGNLIKTNINWQGETPGNDAHFETFINMVYGCRAMMLDLINDIKGGMNTPAKLITEYAPPNENNTAAYIDQVCKGLNMTANQVFTIDEKTIKKLVRIIATVENGPDNKYLTDTDINAAWALVKKKLNIKNAGLSATAIMVLLGLTYLILK